MIMAMANVAFAASLTGSKVGGVTSVDTPTLQDKTITIKKELTVYNVDEATITAPTMSYTYALTAGTADINVTDDITDHANSTAVTVKTKAGVTPTSVVMTGQGQTTGTATIAWAPTETVTASTGGTANYKTLTLDFSSVVFGAAGVYRYVLTETHAAAGVTVTDNTTNPHVRYLDVYVRPAPTGFTDGTAATDWDIYGYVCMVESEEITPSGDTTTTGAVKTDGFVSGSNDSTAYTADSYFTYNVTVSKTVTNDSYAKATHSFPFTVLFTNATITQAVDISSSTTGTTGGFTDPASAALSTGTTNGIVTIKDSSSVKYIGIPNGTQVEVYETNDVTGVTYQVTTTTDGTANVDAAVTDGTTPTSAVSQTTRAAYQSTKTTITPTANADDDTAHTIAVDNNLQVISPTGVTLRVAPYILMLAAGIVLIVLMKSRRRKEEPEEA